MAWQTRGNKRYYTRSKKVNGRVERQYVGGGERGEQAAQEDALKRARRQAERQARQAQEARWQDVQTAVNQLCAFSDLLAHAALVAGGCYRHDRGEWRLRRYEHEAQPASE